MEEESTPPFPASVVRSIPLAVGVPIGVAALAWFGLDRMGFEPRLCYGWVGVVMESIGFLLILALHFLVDWNPTIEFVSYYARDKKYGFLMDWAFACLGIGSVSLGLALQKTFGEGFVYWALVIGGAAGTLLSIFVCDAFTIRKRPHVDPVTLKKTPEGEAHDILAGVTFVVTVPAMLAFCMWPGPALAAANAWLQPASFSVFALALICLIAYALLGIKAKPGDSALPMGLAERLLILTQLEWLGIVAAAVLLSV